jgi:SAM-dependent methyltransferase
LDTVAAERARDNLNQEVFHSLEEALQGLPRQYEVVCFWHSLEHLPEPGKALKTVERLLAPGGLLVISAPHMESLQSRLSGPFWLHLDLPRHLVHFDMNRLARLLQAKGYRLIRQQHFSLEYNVIDTLCYLYTFLGFSHLYPFERLRGMPRHRACINKHTIRNTLGLSLLLPLAALALCGANLFSLLKSGSCVTLFLRKGHGTAKPIC